MPWHDSSIIKLRKSAGDYDPTNRINAQSHIAQAVAKGEVLTGVLYVKLDSEDLHARLSTYDASFNTLGEKELCPEAGMLEKIYAALR